MSSPTDRPTGTRRLVESRSATLLVFLHRLPRWVLLVAVFALLAVGMVGTGLLGASALFVLAAALAWFAYLNWPALDTSGRLLRIIGVAGLLLFAAGHLV
ncbi:MAG: DUF6703 family protein [Actinomadura sp.]